MLETKQTQPGSSYRSWQVGLVDPHDALRFLPLLKRKLENQVWTAPLLYSPEDIIYGVMQKRLAMFIFFETYEEPFLFAVVRLDTFPQGLCANIIALAGSRVRCAMAWSEKFDLWCKIQNAEHITFQTNEKLARLMKRFGYKTVSVAVYKPLMSVH